MAAPLTEIDDQRRQPARMQTHTHDIDRRSYKLRINAGKERRHRGVSRDHIPTTIYRKCRIRLMCLEYEVYRVASTLECGIIKGTIAVNRCIACRQQHDIALS